MSNPSGRQHDVRAAAAAYCGQRHHAPSLAGVIRTLGSRRLPLFGVRQVPYQIVDVGKSLLKIFLVVDELGKHLLTVREMTAKAHAEAALVAAMPRSETVVMMALTFTAAATVMIMRIIVAVSVVHISPPFS